ncbi:MAG: CopG family transcriptional regulator [Micropruina sp.]|uniref:CopG family transcriptional regulator n=1 Tax=Micropruina sp. TaxID=2737536 RepID=UPI0039E290CD
MRTTVNLDADVAAAVARLQRERGIGFSAAVNQLARGGMTKHRVDFRYTHPSYDLGLQVDLTSVADTLELLDELDRADSHAS